jgi:hypothetical protein
MEAQISSSDVQTLFRHYKAALDHVLPMVLGDTTRAYIQAQPSDLTELPGPIIQHSNVNYHVHGIIHGGLIRKPSKKTCRAVARAVAKHRSSLESEAILFEQGLGRHFGFHKPEEMDDVTYKGGLEDYMRTLNPTFAVGR